MSKTKIPKFNNLYEFKAWLRLQDKDAVDRKELKSERRRIKNANKGR